MLGFGKDRLTLRALPNLGASENINIEAEGDTQGSQFDGEDFVII